jgi:hypothetical protein
MPSWFALKIGKRQFSLIVRTNAIYIIQVMNVFIRAMVKIFSFGERWNVPFNEANKNIHYLFYIIPK